MTPFFLSLLFKNISSKTSPHISSAGFCGEKEPAAGYIFVQFWQLKNRSKTGRKSKLICQVFLMNTQQALSTGPQWCVLWKFTFYLPIWGHDDSLMQYSAICIVCLNRVSSHLALGVLHNHLPAVSHRLRLHSISVCCLSAKTKMYPHRRVYIIHSNPRLNHMHGACTVTSRIITNYLRKWWKTSNIHQIPVHAPHG